MFNFQAYEKGVTPSGAVVLKPLIPNDKANWEKKKDLIVNYEISYQIENPRASSRRINEAKCSVRKWLDTQNGLSSTKNKALRWIERWLDAKNESPNNRSTKVKTTLWRQKWVDPKNKRHNPNEIDLSFSTDEDLLIAIKHGFALAKAAGYSFVDVSDIIKKKAKENEGLKKALLDICFGFSLKLNLAGIVLDSKKYLAGPIKKGVVPYNKLRVQ